MKGRFIMVKKKDKETTISAATRTITAEGVHIENGLFVDEGGNIASKIAEYLLNPNDVFNVTIRIALTDKDNESNNSDE